jgi:glutamate N-acetyltransferase/amino-acid N-acetyltransferase
MAINGIISDAAETHAVGVTTGNRYPGAPVVLARERLRSGRLRGLVVNNRVANVASPTGYADAVAVAAACASRFGLPSEQVLSISTGVIGWSLPVRKMLPVVESLEHHETDAATFARGIMTTDRYPKLAWSTTAGGATVLGAVKGAGMVEPNLATMLGFFLTDAVVDPERLGSVFRRVVEQTFNTISIDSDQSTSDMVLLLANGRSGITVSETELEAILLPVAQRLAEEIVRNGEGTSHVIELCVRGVADRSVAQAIGKQVINSPLVKTAVYGNDPNVGRILGACGDALDRYDRDRSIDASALRIAIFGEEVYRDGAFHLDGDRETRLSDALRDTAMDPALHGCPQYTGTVEIVIDFTPRSGRGGETGAADDAPGESAEVRVRGSDLSYEYVRENADYRS